VLTIDRATYDAIVAHARRDHPDEACGVVAGPEGTDRPARFVPMLNAARSPTFYEFDSSDLLALYESGQSDGMILMEILMHDWRVELLRKEGCPFVMIGHCLDNTGLSYVDVDIAAGVKQAIGHLVGLGHLSLIHI
jgi:hypothetical protein